MANQEFSIVPQEETEFLRYLQQIADITGKTLAEVDMREVYAYYQYTIDSQGKVSPVVFSRLVEKYIGEFTLRRRTVEKAAELSNLAELLFDFDGRNITYGTFLPSYAQMLARLKAEKPADSHRALLVGALTPRTIREFSAAVHRQFPMASCMAVDISAEATARMDPSVATFQRADATNLPFEEEFDSVHTNALFHKLESSQPGLTVDRMRDLFYQGAYRALQPGGRLVMVESLKGDPNPFLTFQTEATNAGFSNIEIASAVLIKKKRDVERFFRGTTDNLDPKKLETSTKNFQIFARK